MEPDVTVTCQIHYCELHRGHKCPCRCKPCSDEVRDARNALAAMPTAERPPGEDHC